MPAEIESMMFAGAVPWHGLGNPIPDGLTDIAEGIKAAGLDWGVELIPLITLDGRVVTHKGVQRVTDKEILGVVGPRFVPLQNSEAFEWFEPFLQSGEAYLHTAGSLKGGSRIWVLAKLDRDPLVIRPDDLVEKYLLLSHAHDGTLAVRVGFTPIRVVCNNTLTLAHSDERSQLIRVKHSKQTKVNLEAIRETINTIDQRFNATAEQYKRLADKHINQKDVLSYVELVFGVEPVEERSKQAERLVEDIMTRIYSSSLGNGQGSLWDAYNGVTEYLSWKAGRNDSTRFDSLWFGANANLNQKALDTALELVG